MIYSVRHVTKFCYEPEVREIVMELRMQPRSEGNQRCLNFKLDLAPQANVMHYRDYQGNSVHHFDIPGAHQQIAITSRALVEIKAVSPPDVSAAGDWNELDELSRREDCSEWMLESYFAHSTDKLKAFADEIELKRRATPMEVLLDLNQSIYNMFAYAPKSTKVDSPIDEALGARQGVCQDFAHIMITLLRSIDVPCRYVSGYLAHAEANNDRSPDDASHAWVEALVPKLGWIGFDPTNNLVGGDRHIRVAVGRDYADVPPNRGVYKGESQSELSVAVSVTNSAERGAEELFPTMVARTVPPRVTGAKQRLAQEQQQQ